MIQISTNFEAKENRGWGLVEKSTTLPTPHGILDFSTQEEW